MWWCHKLLSRFLAKGHLPQVPCQSCRSANDRVIISVMYRHWNSQFSPSPLSEGSVSHYTAMDFPLKQVLVQSAHANVILKFPDIKINFTLEQNFWKLFYLQLTDTLTIVHHQESMVGIRALRMGVDFTGNTMSCPASVCNTYVAVSAAIKIKLLFPWKVGMLLIS